MINCIKKSRITIIILIYLIYISLGVPDSILGVAWPEVKESFGVPIYYGSIIMTIVSILAAFSSVMYTYIVDKLSVEKIVVYSCFLTAIGLLLIGCSTSFFMICFAAIPLGIGAGAADASLNNFVSENLNAKHMIWLHGFWGVGAVIGPTIYSVLQRVNYTWKLSTILISMLQFILVVILFLGRKKIKEYKSTEEKNIEYNVKSKCNKYLIFLRILYIFVFSGFDVSINLWLATYLQECLNYNSEIASIVVTLYFASVMLSRFVVGIVSKNIEIKKIIFLGLIISALGTFLLLVSFNISMIIVSVLLTGMGMCVVYPFTLYENHICYEIKEAQKITSFQIAFNLVGGLIFPIVLGLFMTYVSTNLYIWFQLTLIIIAVVIRLIISLEKNIEKE